MYRMIVLLLTIFVSTSVLGFDTHDWDLASPHKIKCDQGNQIENNFCINSEYKASDQKLNELYKKLVAALADPKPLIAAQRAWLKFRDAQCKFKVGEHDGSAKSYSEDACLIDLTEKRILDLKSIWPCNGCVLFKDEYYREGMWPTN